MARILRDFFFDPFVLLALFVAVWILAGLNEKMHPVPAVQTIDWGFHYSCVELAHGIIDYGAYPMQSYWDAGCPAGTLDGTICGYIDDAECRRLLREWGR